MNYLMGSLFCALLFLLQGCGSGGSNFFDDTPSQTDDENASSKSLPLLLIRVEFLDVSFTHDASVWSNKIFGNTPNTLNNYYQENSNGAFMFSSVTENQALENDGVITVFLSKNHPDSGYDESVTVDLETAIEQADRYVDFSQFDTDGNHAISIDELQIMFLFAGGEDAYGPASQPSVWAHANCISNLLMADGVTLMSCSGNGQYSLFGERHGDHDATIGIIAHELGHAAFDLPDLYDTVESSSYGIGAFGLMGYGSWGATASDYAQDLHGNTPTHFCAWSKITNGWLTPEIVNSTTTQTIALHATSSSDYNVIRLPISDSEYFLVENRDNSGYDAGLYIIDGIFDGGMAIWHIDENVIEQKFATNTVNNDETHRGVDLEDANRNVLDDFGSYSYGHEKNLFYLGNQADFTPYSLPNSDSYTGLPSGIRVENISARGLAMTADFTR